MKRPIRIVVVALLASACGGGGGSSGQNESPPPPPPPPNATFEVMGSSKVDEYDNPLVTVTLSLDRAADGEVSAPVTIAGTATRDYDYVASADAFNIEAGQASDSIEIDIYRDFEAEGDETITVELGALTGEAELSGNNMLIVDIVDGESAAVLKGPEDFEGEDEDLTLFTLYYQIGETSVDFGVQVWNSSDETVRLQADLATDIDFEQNVEALGAVAVEPIGDDPDLSELLGHIQPYSVSLENLTAETTYYIRAYLGDPPASIEEALEEAQERFDVVFLGFATDASGAVRTRCHAPSRTPDPSGEDPFFSEQWHLVNTGQMAFSDSAGVAGADLDMRQAIDDGLGGDGVKLAVVDTGLEICHPDLVDNIVPGGSYNFAFEHTPGARHDDPFHLDIFGDHGTSVAGVAAAVASNGLGGRGVAPQVELVGFNLGVSFSDDPERDAIRSLGGSTSMPDSASVDVFNMSWGSILPSENTSPDFVSLLKHGTSELRNGLGALYVKAAGNSFGQCLRRHALNDEVGCLGSNTDPDQNLPHTLTIGGFNASDVKSSYSSAGANLWVVAPSGEDGLKAPAIITTDQAGIDFGYDIDPRNRLSSSGDYISGFGGTSSAAPALAGVIALLLESAPALTWRDVKHVLAVSARKIDPDRRASRVAYKGHPYIAQHAWQTNDAGYDFHNWYGFGAVSVDDAIELAATHMPASLGTFSESDWFVFSPAMDETLTIPDADGSGISRTIDIANPLTTAASIEAVILEISVEHPYPIELGITLTSPSGMPSVLNAPFNSIFDGFHQGIQSWQLMSNAFYGESIHGEWTLQVVDLAEEDEGRITNWRLKFYYGEHGDGAASRPRP